MRPAASRASCVRRLLAGAVAVAIAAASAPASAQAPAGVWTGHYVCGQGVTALDLSLRAAGGHSVTGVFHFGALPPHRPVPEGCFGVRGSFDPLTGALALSPTTWLLHPDGYVMVGLQGRMGRDGATLAGQVRGGFGCGGFTLRRTAAVPPRAPACAAAAPMVALAAH